MLKRLAAVAALSLIPTVAVVAPADAARSCNVTVPKKVAVTSPYKAITAKYSSGCKNYADYAYWDVMHRTHGFENILIYDSTDGRSSEVMDWYDWSPKGTYTVRAEDAWDHNYNFMTQNSPKMTVKLGSKVTSSSSRSGKYVTMKGTVTRYRPSASGYRTWSGAKVSLQRKSCSSCSWKTIKTGTTNRYGKVSLKTYAKNTRYWRLNVKETSVAWGRAGTTLKR